MKTANARLEAAREPRWRTVAPSRASASLAEDARAGLFARPRSLPPKYFYDAAGSQLFDRICDTPEYYLTRAEAALLACYARDIIDRTRPAQILELGSGVSRKTRHLFDACSVLRCHPEYRPFDVCQEMLIEAGTALLQEYDWLRVNALVGDYLAGLDNLPAAGGPALVAFLGSTIGNFEEEEAVGFLREVRALLGPDDRMLLGADRVKAPAALHAAYNDAAGLTARFNLNVLEVLNRELGADFDRGAFRHYAHYNPRRARMEMYLVAGRAQRVRFSALDEVLDLAEGEAIRTEVSRKFTRGALEALLEAAGFAVERHYEADGEAFSLVLARPA